jgi:hypothetical protein
MKHPIKNTLRAMTRHLGLKAKFVDYLDDDTHGKLLIKERRILLNARKSRSEHFYTILHEIGHFVVHHTMSPRDYCPRFLRKDWKRDSIDRIFSLARRYLRFILNSSAGKEWEADLWAICAFILLTRRIGCRTELVAFLERHPEKTKTFLLATSVITCSNVKKSVTSLFKSFLPVFCAR